MAISLPTQKFFWPNLVGAALLIHVALILVSILEVAFYSYLIEPGKDQSYYSEHANLTGPWISGIVGPIFMFLFVRRYMGRFGDRHLTYAIALPFIYIILDLLMLIAAGVNLMDVSTQTIAANVPKILGALAAYALRTKSSSSPA